MQDMVGEKRRVEDRGEEERRERIREVEEEERMEGANRTAWGKEGKRVGSVCGRLGLTSELLVFLLGYLDESSSDEQQT